MERIAAGEQGRWIEAVLIDTGSAFGL